MTQQERHYYVYIVASRTHIIYIGVTNNLKRRVKQHRNHELPGFTHSYQCERLVWFESYLYIYHALDREKQLKRWRRDKKIWLIEKTNPTWADLSETWRE
jgi:putative endonuclease